MIFSNYGFIGTEPHPKSPSYNNEYIIIKPVWDMFIFILMQLQNIIFIPLLEGGGAHEGKVPEGHKSGPAI